ncbi:MAG: cysteine desulfurase [Bacteroidales bacterium]|nr:cysteine desulfurase [Bacteroidales bacterium]MDD3907487.1 cysteine desulfurase [Bacteroidales bacterium]MDD4711949.1 cysteine desulfurase [Bacteroidales bacterium]
MDSFFKDIRSEFPILSRKIYGKDLVYLDNGATTQKPRRVVEKIENGYYYGNANIHRGVHYLSQRATEAHEAARERVRQFLHADSASEIIFTRGTTESINLVAFSFGEAFCKEGDEIVVSVMEHHSNIVPWQMLCERKKMFLKVIPMNDRGEILLDEYKALLNPKVKLIAITHVSNVLGTVNPVKEMIALAHAAGIKVLVDGAQSVPHIRLDVKAMDADFFAFSGHKIYGPTGIGVLYGKAELLNQIPPYQGGGEMIDQVHFEKTTYNVLPYKFEAGTPDFIGSTALSEALDFVEEIGIERIEAYEKSLLEYATMELMKIDGMRIIGTAADKSAVLSFLLGDIHPFDVGTLLDHLGIAVRTGHHCAQPLIERLGIDGTVRASFALYNTFEEVDVLVKALKRIQTMF